MTDRLDEDMIGRLAAQFNTLPDVLQAATGQCVPVDESPSFYKGFITAMMMAANLLSEQRVPINYDVLYAIASKAAQLRQGLLAEEQDTTWIDQINAWIDANYKSEARHMHH
jgi:hypothetical protein